MSFNGNALQKMESLMSTKDKLVFSVSREDLLYNYASTFKEIFHFTPKSDDELSEATGVRFQETLGFDFENETSPKLRILQLSDVISGHLDEDPSQFSIFVSLEDIALGNRSIIFSKPVDEITEPLDFKIDLKSFSEFGFYRGYIVKCFISRTTSVDPNESKYWSKSNILYQSEFIVKSTVDEALFEIAWTDFNDQKERKDLLYCINWVSDDVSQESHSQTFQVVANNDLKSQFKRLENNSLFGGLTIRLIADRIICELAETTLQYADLECEPLEGSLHEKMQGLFSDLGLEFNSEAIRYQSGDATQILDVRLRVNKAIQVHHSMASTLMDVKFGGFRK